MPDLLFSRIAIQREQSLLEEALLQLQPGSHSASMLAILIGTIILLPKTNKNKKSGWKPSGTNIQFCDVKFWFSKFIILFLLLSIDTKHASIQFRYCIDELKKDESAKESAVAQAKDAKQRSAYQAGAEKEGLLMYEESPNRWIQNWISLKEGRLYLFSTRTVSVGPCCFALLCLNPWRA